jgi:hypothetical protein
MKNLCFEISMRVATTFWFLNFKVVVVKGHGIYARACFCTCALVCSYARRNPIPYKNVVVLGKNINTFTSNNTMCHKRGYLVYTKLQTELEAK